MKKRIAFCAVFGLLMGTFQLGLSYGANPQKKPTSPPPNSPKQPTSPPPSSPKKPNSAPPTVAACVLMTLDKSPGVTCTRGGVTFMYTSNNYTASGPAPTPAQIVIVMDSNGPNATLVGSQANFQAGWKVGAGQVWSFTISYTVNAPIGKISLAQLGAVATGDGSVTATQTAGGASSTITCTAAVPCASISSGAYSSFTPGQVPASVTLTMNGGQNGTASISQLSQHLQ